MRVAHMIYVMSAVIGSACVALGASGSDITEYWMGGGEEFWQMHIVIYASVDTVTEKSPMKYDLSLRPVATLAGALDCTAVRKIEGQVVVGGLGALNRTLPRVGAKCVVLVRDLQYWGLEANDKMDAAQNEYDIPMDYVLSFMPNDRWPIVEVSGIEDPVVASIQENIRALRERYEKEGNPLDNLEWPESPPGQTREEAVREFEASRKAELERRAEGLRQLILKGPPSGSPPALESDDIATSDSMGTTSSASSVPAED